MSSKQNPNKNSNKGGAIQETKNYKTKIEDQLDGNLESPVQKSVEYSVLIADPHPNFNDELDLSTADPIQSDKVHEDLPEEVFKVKNLDTGEEVDIRDENRDSFTAKFAKLLVVEDSEEIEDIYKRKRKINSSLWEAVQRNDINRIKELLDRDTFGDLIAQTNTKGLDDWTALHLAASDGFRDACEILMQNGESTDIDAKTSMLRTPLHLACIHGHLSVVKLLVNQGADINAVDIERSTPLYYASFQGHLTIVKYLLRKGPDIAIKNHLGITAWAVALNMQVFNAFTEYCQKEGLEMPESLYARTPFHTVMLHNSRTDSINKILMKCKHMPSAKDLQAFKERPTLSQKKAEMLGQLKDVLPPCKVGPKDFKGILQLGRGSFGEVYLVEKIDNGEQFALKVLRKDKVFENNLVRYAFTERNILLKISHPYIVKLNYAFQTPEKLVLVMDFCPNGDLGTHLAREKKFDEHKARFYISEVLLALQELHIHDIIFRDLKPENVVLDKDGHARLTDFGLSKEGVHEGELNKSFCGSVAYLAPEMLRRAGHTRSVDWYLLGVLLYEMIVGTPPYYSNNREQLFNNIQRGVLKIPKSLSEEAKDLIKRLIIRDPNKRLGACKRDAEEIKEHPFFHDVDWGGLMVRAVPAPPVKPIRRIPKEQSLEKMFGRLDQDEPAPRLDQWSILKPS